MNPTNQPQAHPGTSPPESDAALRQQLRASLSETPPPDHAALQERVLAQWQQRHPAAEHALAGAQGAALSGQEGSGRLRLWLLGGSLLLGLALALGWANRADPTLDELMQPDVLSQIGLGEL